MCPSVASSNSGNSNNLRDLSSHSLLWKFFFKYVKVLYKILKICTIFKALYWIYNLLPINDFFYFTLHWLFLVKLNNHVHKDYEALMVVSKMGDSGKGLLNNSLYMLSTQVSSVLPTKLFSTTYLPDNSIVLFLCHAIKI